MKHLLTICFLIYGLGSYSQDKGEFKNALKSAMHIHDTATIYASSLAATKILENAGEKFKDEWLANYWAAYIHTQCGLYKDRPKNAGETIPGNAQKNLDIVKERYTGDSVEILSDIHALQSFVYQIHTWYPEFKNQQPEYIEKTKNETTLALRYNPDNPLIYVILGTNMVRSDKLSDILGGRALLYQARTEFQKSMAHHPALTTQWNEPWLRFFWLNNADNLLNKALNK